MTITATDVTVAQLSSTVTVPVAEAVALEVRRRRLRTYLVEAERPVVALRGISKSDAADLGRALRRLALTPVVAAAVAWHAEAGRLLAWARAEQRWMTTEAVTALQASMPEAGFLRRARVEIGPTLTASELEALAFDDAELRRLAFAANEALLTAELTTRRRFFETIEKSPLTDEQARAVACFDSRVQVLAAAGSGKTSVMVARGAYAVTRGLVAPERILLLAFNKAAAAELQERINARFAAAGIDSTGSER